MTPVENLIMREKHYKILGLLHSKPILVTNEAYPLTTKGLFTIKSEQEVLNENGLRVAGTEPTTSWSNSNYA